MRILRSPGEAGAFAPVALAIGNFDGVHLGHRALLDAAQAAAARLGGQALALTFEPHPSRFLTPASAPAVLTSPSRKLELLAELGLAGVIVQPFDAAFAGLEAEDFVHRYLTQGVRARAVVVGPDFAFGRGRMGNTEALGRWLSEAGAELLVVPKVKIDGEPVSSSRIRELLQAGLVAKATQLLGRPYDIDGTVRTGAGRGRALGWPTANVATEEPVAVAPGVYAVRVAGPFGELPGALNLGRAPTFGEGLPLSLEVHLIGYQGASLVGARLRVKFIARLRAELRFPSVEALKAQIAADVAAARLAAS